MRIVVRADDGDEITINADELATEQRIVRLEIHNLIFDEVDEFEPITLTVERARELASAIMTIANSLADEKINCPATGTLRLGAQQLL